VKSPRRFAALAALCGAVALGGWVAAGFAGLGSLGIETSGPPIEVSRASATARAEHVDASQATAMGKDRSLRDRNGERHLPGRYLITTSKVAVNFMVVSGQQNAVVSPHERPFRLLLRIS
jgi:hypothetical protein